MRRLIITLVICVFVCVPVVGDAATGRRIALVIGNSNYPGAPLKNPVNDATDMASALRELGFSVTLKINANQKVMERAIRDLGKQLRTGGVGLFYFAGHGIQVKGSNYLIPIGAVLESEGDAKYEAVDAGLVLAKMEDAGNGLNIVILDACRDNPFARSFRSSANGLAKMDAPRGSILAYSTAPGSVAADGTGRNGLYTAKLLKYISTPNTKIETLFKKIRIDVGGASGGKQTPWESSSLMGDFYFNPEKNISSEPDRAISIQAKQGPQNLNAEEEMWEIVKTSSEIEDYTLFLEQYPNSRFYGAARLKIQQLKRKQKAQKMVAVSTPAVVDSGNLKNRQTAQNKYKLALFPVKIIVSWEAGAPRYESHMIEAVDRVGKADNRIEFTDTYKRIKELPNTVMLMADKVGEREIKVWEKKSIISKSIPDWKQINKLCRKIDVDIAVLIRLSISSTSTADVYLYDCKNEKIYSTIGESTDWSSVHANAEKFIANLLLDFFNDQ